MVKLRNILSFGALAVLGCTNELPLSDLLNNTMTLKLLGTYESNDPYGWLNLPVDDVITTSGVASSDPAIGGGSDLVNYVLNASTGLSVRPNDLKFYIDIAEIRIARGQGKAPGQPIPEYWSQFAISRQLLCSDYATAEPGRILQNCADQNGSSKLHEFFNGGFTYPAVDIEHGNYNHLGIYFRRFVTAPAVGFLGNGTFINATAPERTMVATFDNRSVYGMDVASLLQNNYGEAAAEPRMFPLQRKDLKLFVEAGHEPYVLEVRVFVKNNMMVHILQPAGGNAAVTYVAPIDWNTNHAYRDLFNGERQGGSLLMTARTYQPAKSGAIQFSAPATAGEYFGVTEAATMLTTPNMVLPLAATRGTNTRITNLPPGNYNVYRLCDKTRCSNASTPGGCDQAAGQDGYPETVAFCGQYTVSSGTTTNVPLASCSSACP